MLGVIIIIIIIKAMRMGVPSSMTLNDLEIEK